MISGTSVPDKQKEKAADLRHRRSRLRSHSAGSRRPSQTAVAALAPQSFT